MTNLEEKEQHLLANEYKFLCENANDAMKLPKNADVGESWKKVDSSSPHRSNFKGVLYRKGDQYALCFVGTDKFSIKDHGANLKMGITGTSQQIEDAKAFAERMSKKYSLTSSNTVSIGHSEGGTEATHVGIKNNFKTITFNAFGASKREFKGNYDDLVTNYRDPHDPVSKLHANVGKTYITPTTQNKFMKTTPFGSVQSHGINNMGDCDTAIPLEEYKQKNPMFLDKITEAEITREDIAQMDSDLFRVYESELDERLKNNQIFSANQLVGSDKVVYVNSYTRDDGTKVSGYYRRLA